MGKLTLGWRPIRPQGGKLKKKALLPATRPLKNRAQVLKPSIITKLCSQRRVCHSLFHYKILIGSKHNH